MLHFLLPPSPEKFTVLWQCCLRYITVSHAGFYLKSFVNKVDWKVWVLGRWCDFSGGQPAPRTVDTAGLISCDAQGCRHIVCGCPRGTCRSDAPAAHAPDATLQQRGVMVEAKQEPKSEIGVKLGWGLSFPGNGKQTAVQKQDKEVPTSWKRSHTEGFLKGVGRTLAVY